MQTDDENVYQQYLLDDLTKRHGQIIAARDLHKLLGFKSYSSFKRCVLRGNLSLRLLTIEGRRGRHSMTVDVVNWLVERWCDARKQTTPENEPRTGGAQ